MITSTLGAQHFRKKPEPALFASESDGIAGEERHFTAELPVRKVETETHKVGEQRGSAASYCRLSHVPSCRSYTQRHAVATIAYMERLVAQYTSHRRPEPTPEPPRPLIPDDLHQWPPALRPQLIERRMQAVITMERAERSYREAQHAHRMAWAGWDQARRERGY
jgi:hypothetical protein